MRTRVLEGTFVELGTVIVAIMVYNMVPYYINIQNKFVLLYRIYKMDKIKKVYIDSRYTFVELGTLIVHTVSGFTANPRTNIVDFGGFYSSIILI